ncbi:hypothetical protein ACTI_19410 [Actinoplanes sp. OR16]|uniref:hypothetical protein n=1 Tax=Actinoplanes sp. OR16 TaxID=946334 RepID=UPI000F6DF93D|nr:hypothetical protein [Actinoplanes sp. OR16]BBH65256.1 hypothetical protein ACTI_19410 [Actinoplanes sp. OR16]
MSHEPRTAGTDTGTISHTATGTEDEMSIERMPNPAMVIPAFNRLNAPTRQQAF